MSAVPRGSAAHRAGIDVHDEIVAIDGRRVEDRLDPTLVGREPGERVQVVLARDGRIRTVDVTLDALPRSEGKILPKPDATADEIALRIAFLGEDIAGA